MAMVMRRAFVTGCTSFPGLEADVLQSFGGLSVQVRRSTVVSTSGSKVALRHPDPRAAADRRELLEACIGLGKRLLGLVQALLLGQRAPEDEL